MAWQQLCIVEWVCLEGAELWYSEKQPDNGEWANSSGTLKPKLLKCWGISKLHFCRIYIFFFFSPQISHWQNFTPRKQVVFWRLCHKETRFLFVYFADTLKCFLELLQASQDISVLPQNSCILSYIVDKAFISSCALCVQLSDFCDVWTVVVACFVICGKIFSLFLCIVKRHRGKYRFVV